MEKHLSGKGNFLDALGGKLLFEGCVYVCVHVYVCLHTRAHTCKSTCRCVGTIAVLYGHCKNLFMVSWPRAKVLTTNLPLNAHLACLQGSRNPSQSHFFRVPGVEDPGGGGMCSCSFCGGPGKPWDPDFCPMHAEVW